MPRDPHQPLRLVLDTNVVLDLLHFADAAALPILNALETRGAHGYASAETLDELRRVLAYPEFQLDAVAQTILFSRYLTWVCVVEVSSLLAATPRCSDPDDQMFLQLARSTDTDYLVSKDKALLTLNGHRELTFAIISPYEAGVLLLETNGGLRHAAMLGKKP